MAQNPNHRKKPIGVRMVQWLRLNLFSSPANTALTLLGMAFLAWAIPPVLGWAFLDANWTGASRAACDTGGTGACWLFIKVRLKLFIYGFYPEPEHWRINLSFVVLLFSILPLLLSGVLAPKKRQVALFAAACAGIDLAWGMAWALVGVAFFFLPFALTRFSLKPVMARLNLNESLLLALAVPVAAALAAAAYLPMAKMGAPLGMAWILFFLGFFLLGFKPLSLGIWRWIFLLTVYPVWAFVLLRGGAFGLDPVETHFWGGLFLTLLIACVGLATCLPLGVLFALGRQSKMPAIKIICVFTIELLRGVPLVSVLFMASVMFPLFLPEGAHFDKLLRALIGVSVFYAVYVAEVIRGGLQAIPKGQYEAARALGWGYWKMMTLIIIPQVLRLVIPGLTNNILSLFKDTTLVAVIGLLDLLGVAKAAMADAQWLGFTKEAYIFAGAVFWVFCFSISRYCNHLERKYHTGYHQ